MFIKGSSTPNPGAAPVAPRPATSRNGNRGEPPCIAVVLKGYPRLSETFIAQELKALEDLGMHLRLFSLRRPTDRTIHPIHGEIHAACVYLPEYVWREPLRVLAGLWHALLGRRAGPAFAAFWRDLRRDPTPNRVRRLAQALVMAREFPAACSAIYAHFIHTPGSVARYASLLLDRPFALSAHAKDIWTIPDWEKREKLADCTFAVTCTAANATHLRRLAARPERVYHFYHGIDLDRFPDPGSRDERADGSPGRPAILLSVGRAVPKKGYANLLGALARIDPALHWRFRHIGGGPELAALSALAERLGIAGRISWLGPQPQDRVLGEYRGADLFVLASTITADGDRDGLPNVLMEAQSQRLCCVATRVSAIPELIVDGETGFLVEDGEPDALAATIARLIARPATRRDSAERALERLRRDFSAGHEAGHLKAMLETM